MTKKVFRTSVVSILMLTGCFTPSAFAIIPNPQPEAENAGQVFVKADDVPSEPIDSVEESKLTQEMMAVEKERPMTQEEKKRNAEENDEYGGGITVVAMGIVISALAILSILFLIFGKISASMLTKKKLKSKGLTSGEADDHHSTPDSGEVIAAISMALAEHIDGKGHDLERTILTLRRMKRAYSPWNSKIYNIRHVPEPPVYSHNPSK